MAAEASRSSSSSSGESYIGSLISLTSKSEIRYEGILYNIDTQETSIGLRNVRTFGTEGRKKEGAQVPPSDKVYEYILFRGSDIKDLQVESSPPVQATASINSDPAIIQSHYPRPASTSASLPATVSGSLTDHSSLTSQVGHPGPGSTFQGGIPLYHPGGNVGTWGSSPSPANANGNGLAMPMYWQGFYGPPNGVPHLQQQSLLLPPPGLPVTSSMQQPLQYPGFSAPLPTGAWNLSGSNLTPPLLSDSANSSNSSSTFFSSSPLPSTLPPAPSTMLASELRPPWFPPSSALPPSTLNTNFPSLSTTSSPDISGFVPPLSNMPNANPALSLPFQAMSQPISPLVGASGPSPAETPAPSLITPGQLLKSTPTMITSSLSSETAHKDVEVIQGSSASTKSSVAVPKETQPPILPLPVPAPARAIQKFNGAPFQTNHNYRGRERGRGSGSSRPLSKFNEDFDFTAMNEKFNKDEVWGHLGRINGSHSKGKQDELTDDEEFQEEDDAEPAKIEVKPVYNKDDFFDTLSGNDGDSRNGRPRFSEQMKIDTETFGDFSTHRGSRGGRGYNRGGRSRGAYYGRGYGYAGRGRGWARNRGRGWDGGQG